MKGYHDQLVELQIEEARLETLKEKKELLLSKITSCTSNLKSDVVGGTSINDKMTKYVIACEEVNKQISMQEDLIKILKDGLDKMDKLFKTLKGTQERVFYLYYKEKYSPVKISNTIPCSLRSVYYHLDKIKEVLEKEAI